MTKQTVKLAHNRATPNTANTRTAVPFSAKFNIKFIQFLDPDARVVRPLPSFASDPEKLIELYSAMLKTRLFDKKAISLQRRGQLGTYASSMGQEAIGTAAGSAMQPEDVLVPAYREYAAQFLRGVRMQDILLYWGGNETGMNFAAAKHDFPVCIPIASQIPQAVGVAYAMQYRKEKRVTLCIFGDGATSKGDFYEAINAAGIWNLPLVFLINNNQWAISLPRTAQSRAETLAQKAIAAGIEGQQVDGNDVIAVRYCVQKALDKARRGNGPTLIEALTYRLCDHTTADDASRYRDNDQLEEHWRYEPLIRLREYLEQNNFWTEADEKTLVKTIVEEVENAVKDYLATPTQAPTSMFDYLYETLPDALSSQRESVKRRTP